MRIVTVRWRMDSQVRRVLDLIRGQTYERALITLEYSPWKASEQLIDVLISVCCRPRPCMLQGTLTTLLPVHASPVALQRSFVPYMTTLGIGAVLDNRSSAEMLLPAVQQPPSMLQGLSSIWPYVLGKYDVLCRFVPGCGKR